MKNLFFIGWPGVTVLLSSFVVVSSLLSEGSRGFMTKPTISSAFLLARSDYNQIGLRNDRSTFVPRHKEVLLRVMASSSDKDMALEAKDLQGSLFLFRQTLTTKDNDNGNDSNIEQKFCVVYGEKAKTAILDKQDGWEEIMSDVPLLLNEDEVAQFMKQKKETVDDTNKTGSNDKNDQLFVSALATPYSSDTERRDALQTLLEQGASIQRTNAMMRAAVDSQNGANNIEILLDLGGSVADCDRYGSTPLHIAAAFTNLEAIEILLKNGADTSVQDQDGLTPKMVFERTVKRDQEMELEYGTPLPKDERVKQERIQLLFEEAE